MLGKFPALRSGGGVTPLSQRNVRGGVMKRRPRPLRMCSSDLDGGGGGKEAPLTYFETFKKLPIIRTVIKFASWVLFSLQSLLFVRMQYLVRATSTLQRALLDSKQQLVRMPACPLPVT